MGGEGGGESKVRVRAISHLELFDVEAAVAVDIDQIKGSAQLLIRELASILDDRSPRLKHAHAHSCKGTCSCVRITRAHEYVHTHASPPYKIL